MKRSNQHTLTLAVLLGAISVLRCLIWLSPAPMMETIMADLALNYAQGGMILQIVSVMMGLSLFVGSPLIDRIGTSRTLALACLLLGMDGILGYCSAGYGLLMAGRVSAGIGMGLSMGSMNALIAERFSRKMQTVMNTLNLVLSSLGMALAYVVSVPLMHTLFSYRGVLLLWGLITLAIAAAFFLTEKNQLPSALASQAMQHTPSSLRQVVRFRNIWILSAATAGAMWVYNSFSSYLPVFLSSVHQMSAAKAGNATSIMQFSGIAGSVLWGWLLGRGVHPRLLLTGAVLLLFIGALGTALLAAAPFLFVCIFLIGMGYYAFQASAVTAIMQMDGMQPQMVGAATAVYTGVGSLLGLAAPYAFSAIQTSQGMRAALAEFSLLAALSAAVCLFYRENRAKR